MPTSDDLIREAEALPLEDRLRIVDSLLRTLNPPDAEIDRQWIAEARRRRDEIQSGEVQPVSGAQVLKKLRDRFPNA